MNISCIHMRIAWITFVPKFELVILNTFLKASVKYGYLVSQWPRVLKSTRACFRPNLTLAQVRGLSSGSNLIRSLMGELYASSCVFLVAGDWLSEGKKRKGSF